MFQVAGFMAVVLMGTWTGHFLGGFSWQSDPQHQFNWHPLLMTIGLIFLYGNGECFSLAFAKPIFLPCFVYYFTLSGLLSTSTNIQTSKTSNIQ
jgi:cytochrome b-561